ncbi:dihydrolipoamide acetyltransferase family protein [Streptomyces sp. NPDC101132]|uniref:dihydrolipoamide acetyltransferase family protein n=1 Tax=Streptomyces sp. NPDC101132 TaxID=3366110 RepID=UPI00380A898B
MSTDRSDGVGTTDFLLPDLGEGLTEAEVVRWLVAEGDAVAVDQPVVEVETAKATVEVPSPYAGRVATLHAAEGAVLEVGRPLISFAPDTGVPVAPGAAAGADAAGTGAAEPEGSGRVLIGYGTQPSGVGRRRPPRRSLTGAGVAAGGVGPGPAAPAAGAVLVVSPVVRALAARHGLDLAGVSGSGAGGVITRQDVDAALAERDLRRAAEQAGTEAAAARPAAAAGDGAGGGLDGVDRVPLKGVRGAIARKVARAAAVPTATVWVDVDATELLALRARQDADGPGLLALLARFTVAGLRRYPELNATVRDDEILRHRDVHLGVAAQTDAGLLVPVVRGADRMSARTLHAEVSALVGRARDGALTPAELSGGTFTLNNFGVFGVDGSSMLLNAPEAGILGIGRIVERPWSVGGRVLSRKTTQLSLVFDHRACDGGAAGGFLRFVADCIEDPVRALADL